MLLQDTSDLSQCEERLKCELNGRSLIGEVELSDEDVSLLGNLLGDELRCSVHTNKGLKLLVMPSDRVQHIWRNWPCCTACYTVGVFCHYGCHENELWPKASELLGVKLTSNQQEVWRDWFEGFLRRNDMFSLERVPGPRTFKRVRIHAMLPRDGARRVFEHVVKEVVARGLPVDQMTAAQVLDELGVGEHTLRKPEEQFLRFGDHVADDILARCVDLYRTAQATGGVPEDTGLPQRIVDGFCDWWEKRGRKAISVVGKWPDTRQPYLRLEDWGQVVLVVPPRKVPQGTEGLALVVRALRGDGQEIKETFALRMDKFKWMTEEREIEVLPASQYHVQWQEARVGDQDEPGWSATARVPCLWDFESVPWAAFRVGDGEIRRVSQRMLPRGEVWLVTPKDGAVEGTVVGGECTKRPLELIEELRLEAWEDMVARLVSTQDLLEAQITLSDGKATSVSVDISPQIELSGRIHGVYSDGLEVVAEAPVVKGVGAGEIVVDVEGPGDEGCGGTVYTRGETVSRLGQILADRAGKFRLVARGRLGRRTEISFVLLPGIRVEFSKPLWGPGVQEPVRAEVSARGLKSLKPEAQDKALSIRRQGDAFVVSGPWDTRRFSLRAEIAQSGGDLSIPLEIAVPRLLVGKCGAERRPDSLSVYPVYFDTTDLSSGQDLYLWLGLEPSRVSWEITLRVEPAGWTQPVQSSRGRGVVLFNIGQCRDALRKESKSQKVWAAIAVDNEPAGEFEVATIALLPTLKKLEPIGRPCEGTVLRYKLEEPLVPAFLRLTCATYPWHRPIDVRIAPGQKEVRLPCVSSGEYIVEVVSADSSERDVIPDPEKGRFLTIPGVGKKHEPLKEWAMAWEQVWRRESAASFDIGKAREADSKAGQLPCPVRDSSEGELREVAILMLWWFRQAKAVGQDAATAYARQAVRRLGKALLSVNVTRERLLQALRQLQEGAKGPTQQLCRDLYDFVATDPRIGHKE